MGPAKWGQQHIKGKNPDQHAQHAQTSRKQLPYRLKPFHAWGDNFILSRSFRGNKIIRQWHKFIMTTGKNLDCAAFFLLGNLKSDPARRIPGAKCIGDLLSQNGLDPHTRQQGLGKYRISSVKIPADRFQSCQATKRLIRFTLKS